MIATDPQAVQGDPRPAHPSFPRAIYTAGTFKYTAASGGSVSET
jgi:hypothetical protein